MSEQQLREVSPPEYTKWYTVTMFYHEHPVVMQMPRLMTIELYYAWQRYNKQLGTTRTFEVFNTQPDAELHELWINFPDVTFLYIRPAFGDGGSEEYMKQITALLKKQNRDIDRQDEWKGDVDSDE